MSLRVPANPENVTAVVDGRKRRVAVAWRVARPAGEYGSVSVAVSPSAALTL